MHEMEYQVFGRRWAGLRSGVDPDVAPQLVALHGWLDNAASFLPLAEALPGIDLLALDLPGHGGSAHRGSWYHFVDWIGDLHQFFESRGWREVVLVGHSLGALMACCYSALFPEQLARLVLIEGLGPLTQPESGTAELMKRAIRQRTRMLARGREKTGRSVSLDTAIRARMTGSDMTEQHARLILQRNIGSDGCHWRADPLLNAVSPLRMSEAQARNVIDGLALPTLLIYGESGYSEVKQAIESRCRWFEQLQLCSVPGGHHCHMTSAEPVAAAIVKFCGLR